MSNATCSGASLAAGEPLVGTAPRGDALLLLEVRGAWGRDALDSVPAEVAPTIRVWLEATPKSKLLLIRRPDRREGELVAFVAQVADRSTIRRFAFARYEDLAETDLVAGGEQVDAPLALVCGHGRRDACCARLGVPLYEALSESLGPESLWLSSHQGGHRFAPNLLWLPAGLAFGRVDPAEARTFVAALGAGQLPLATFRGRTSFEPEAQAAEIAVRQRLDLGGQGDVTLVSIDGKRVRLATPTGITDVDVRREPGPPLPASCGADPESEVRYAVSTIES